MTLGDLRRFTIRKHSQIRFRLRNGMECVVTEHGMAQVPALQAVPDFNLEEELGHATEFLLESSVAPDKKTPVKPQSLKPDELAHLVAGGPTAAASAEHEDD